MYSATQRPAETLRAVRDLLRLSARRQTPHSAPLIAARIVSVEAHSLTAVPTSGAVRDERDLMITRDDLDWWLELAPTLEWVFATTYAQSAPHEYVVNGRTEAMTPEDFVRAAQVIRTFGAPAKFYDSTNIYLHSPDGWKWWGMSPDVTQSDIINRCRVEHVYGRQNAPRTVSGIESAYDLVATEWDAEHGASEDERAGIVDVVRGLIGERPRRILDIGCGTGLALDLSLTDSVRYVGIDPSQAMLNELVLKHPYLAGLHPMRLSDALERRVFGGARFDAVLALGGSASYLTPEDFAVLPALTKRPIVLMHYAEGQRPVTGDLDPSATAAAMSAAEELAAYFGGQRRTVGRFAITAVDATPAAAGHREPERVGRG